MNLPTAAQRLIADFRAGRITQREFIRDMHALRPRPEPRPEEEQRERIIESQTRRILGRRT